jgi:hypothetical protein
MATLTQIRAAIKAKLEAINPSVGKVNDFERWNQAASKMAEQYVYDLGGGVKRLQGLFIAWRGRVEGSPALGRSTLTDAWEMRYFWALEDANVPAASEIEFDNKVEAICDAFRADPTLGVPDVNTDLGNDDESAPAFIQVPEKNHVMFCGVLCHHARMRLSTRHYR